MTLAEQIAAEITRLTEQRLVAMQQKEACQRQASLLTAQAAHLDQEIVSCDGALEVLHGLKEPEA